MHETRPAHKRRRWLGLTAVVLTASALIPAALALACNPQAYLTVDRSSYAPGDSVNISGSFFKSNVDITVSVDRTGQSATVKTSANGAFKTTFAMPSSAATGGYSVQAIGYEANGDVTPGLPARGSFSVAPAEKASANTPSESAQPASQAQASSPAAQDGRPAASQANRPAQQPSSKPAAGFSEPPRFDEPEVRSSGTERRTPSSTSSSSESRSTSREAAPSSDRAVANGRAVFGGSVASTPSAAAVSPVAPAAAAARGGSASAQAVRPRGSSQASRGRSEAPRGSRQASEQTATGDLWGALDSARSPSVLPVANDGMAVTSSGTNSQLALGLVLLGVGGLALAGGLAAAEARRRRVHAR